MKYNITKNWTQTIDALASRPAILLPFFFIAFFEALSLEIIYFSSRKPILLVAGPIVRKFFGESFLHYPGNLIILPKLFYYAQTVIYIFIGVFLISCSVQIFKNTKMNLPVIPNALIKNSVKRYFAFFSYAVLIIVLITAAQSAQSIVFSKISNLSQKYLPMIPAGTLSITISLLSIISLFITTVLIYTFLFMVIPIMVIQGKSLVKALGQSIVNGFRHFTSLFFLIFFPFLVYLPIIMLKSFALVIVNKTFPEINLCVIIVSIVLSAFVDCFIITSLSQFLLDHEKLAAEAS
ncbi:MAG: hypothetical protein KBB52_01745 [Candidatus Omnitrophica bacterium]|nr:hypothetical protein [Candidatus Omnitrophota bacterium]